MCLCDSQKYISPDGSIVAIYAFFDPVDYHISLDFINLKTIDRVSFPPSVLAALKIDRATGGDGHITFPSTSEYFEALVAGLRRDGWTPLYFCN
jgi:hypothetical protein